MDIGNGMGTGWDKNPPDWQVVPVWGIFFYIFSKAEKFCIMDTLCHRSDI